MHTVTILTSEAEAMAPGWGSSACCKKQWVSLDHMPDYMFGHARPAMAGRVPSAVHWVSAAQFATWLLLTRRKPTSR